MMSSQSSASTRYRYQRAYRRLQKELLHAFSNEEYRKVREMLRKGVNPKCRFGETKRAPLHFACQYGWLDIVKVLIEKYDRDPDAKDMCRDTPLHYACRSSSKHASSVVRYLLQTKECNVNCRNSFGKTPIQITPINRADIIHELIFNQRDRIIIVDEKGNPLLHKACQSEEVKTVECLLELNCDPNVKNKSKLTAIQITPIRNTEIIGMLVEAGANPNVQYHKSGNSLLHKACKLKWLETVKCLLQANCDPNCENKKGLAPAQAIKDIEPKIATDIIRELLQHGANPNVQDPDDGNTILHCACRYGVLPLVKCLLEMNCDPNIKNKAGDTPLHVTTVWKEGSLEYIKELIDGGADPNVPDNEGNTLLHHACKNVHAPFVNDCFDYLLQEYANWSHDPNFKNKQGLTPIQVVANPGDTDVFTKLIRIGADVTVTDDAGNTMLHKACKSGELETVKCLLEANCNPNCKNKAGETPLQLVPLCSSSPHSYCMEMITEIIRKGVDPNIAVDTDGNTLLHSACKLDDMYGNAKNLLELGLNPNQVNKEGLIPSQMTKKESVVKLMIQYGANPIGVYKTHGIYKVKRPLQSPIKVFIAGNPQAGKSTLTAALKEEKSAIARRFSSSKKVTGVNQKTAGVVPHDYKSKDNGSMVIYDLAGQKEFYGSHAALMETTILSSPPIFIVVVNLCDENNEIAKNLSYWLSFLEDQCTFVSSKPHIIIVGSHSDKLQEKQEREQKMGILKNKEYLNLYSNRFEFSGTVAMDCQYSDSEGMQKLRQCLKNCCKVLREKETAYADVSFNSHCFFVYLMEKCQAELPAVKLSTVLNHLQEMIKSTSQTLSSGDVSTYMYMTYIPTSYNALVKICEELNDRGHIMFFKDLEDCEEAWIVTDKKVLLEEVTGSIFSPNNFHQHKTITQCPCSTGVVTYSRIKEIAKEFREQDPGMLVTFLSHLEYCHEISDKELLGLITEEHQACIVNKTLNNPNERYFLIPALVSIDAPNHVIWKPKHQFTHYFGWILQCSDDHKHFTSRFLQVLLLQLVFSFSDALRNEQIQANSPTIQRKCSIWKNGILWGDKHGGIETIVEVTPDNKAVILLMRCPELSLYLFQLRSQVIQKILNTAQKFCNQLKTVESVIEPSHIKHYPLQMPNLNLYSIGDIAQAALETPPQHAQLGQPVAINILDVNGCPVSTETLVLYEPYLGLGITVIQKLFRIGELSTEDKSCTEMLNDSTIETIAKRVVHNNPRWFMKIFNKDGENVMVTVHDVVSVLKTLEFKHKGARTYHQNLTERLNRFSVFAGRNPIALAGLDPDSEFLSDESDTESHRSTKDKKPTLQQLCFMYDHNGKKLAIRDEVAARWESFAIALGFECHDIDCIMKNNRQDAKGACTKVLMQWLDSEKTASSDLKPVTWEALIECMKEAEYSDLAERTAAALPK